MQKKFYKPLLQFLVALAVGKWRLFLIGELHAVVFELFATIVMIPIHRTRKFLNTLNVKSLLSQ